MVSKRYPDVVSVDNPPFLHHLVEFPMFIRLADVEAVKVPPCRWVNIEIQSILKHRRATVLSNE